MGKKKVTLSIESDVYNDFQRYCEDNAIMLSKKIEIIMKNISKGKKNYLGFFIFTFLIAFCISNASAASIFSDDFEDGDLAGWSLTTQSGANAWTNSNTDPSQGLRHAQDNPQSTSEPAGVMERTISTAGYSNITFNYSRKLVSIDSADEFQVEYNTGSGWNILEQTGSNSADDSSYVLKNFTLPVSVDDGSLQIKFECTAGAVSEICRVDEIIISGNQIDSTAPSFSNFVENPINGSLYSDSSLYQLNVTINENLIASKGLEFNGINYTNEDIINISNVYVFNISSLSAGNYQYYWWANDTNRNYNVSGIRYYTVVKATPSLAKMLNGADNNLSVQYPQQINASGTSNAGTLSIYRNGILINNGQNYSLGAGFYRFDFNVSGNENYSDYSESLFANISKKQAATSLTFDLPSPQNYSQQIIPTCSIIEGSGTAELRVNNSLISSGSPITLGGGVWTFNCSLQSSQNYTYSENVSQFTIDKSPSLTSLNMTPLNTSYGNSTNFSCSSSQNLQTILYINGIDKSSEKSQNIVRGAGDYTVNCTSLENQNYSGSSDQQNYNVAKASSDSGMLLSGNLSIIYGTTSDFNGSEINSGDGDCTYSLNKVNGVYGVGTWLFNYSTSGCSNYTSGSLTKILEVNKSSPMGGMIISLTPSTNEIYGTQTSSFWSETNPGDGDLVYLFYRNNQTIANPNTETLNAGTYNYTLNTTGGANYTSGRTSILLTINKTSNLVQLYLNSASQNLSSIYGQTVNASASSTSGNVNLFRNGAEILSENNQNNILAAGYYEYLANSSGNQNYLENNTGKKLYLNISKANSNISLYLNGNKSNLIIQEDSLVNLSAYLLAGQGNIIIYIDSTIIYSGSSPGQNITNFTIPGVYNVTVSYPGNENYSGSSEGFFVNVTVAPDITSPSLNITSPLSSQIFGYNQSLPLNYSVYDLNLESCWYNIDHIQNISLPGCNNITFNTSDGSHTINLYANDSSGNIGLKSVSFNVQVGSPNIAITSPTSLFYPYNNITFSYIASDPDGISSCELWADFNGTYSLNESNSSISSGIEHKINVTLNDGVYNYSISCNDSMSLRSTTNNITIIIDTTYPIINLSEPGGLKNTRNNIPILFSIDESYLDSCWYNIYRGAIVEVPNTQVNCTSNNNNFSVTLDADFVINLYAEDLVGNLANISSLFSVSTSSTNPGGGSGNGGGGGGGSGGGTIINRTQSQFIKIEFSDVGEILISPGESKILQVTLKNTGKTFLNRCRLVGKDSYSTWFESSDIKNINIGEISEFIFKIVAPFDAKINDSPELNVVCLEKETPVPIKVIVLESGLNIDITSMNLISPSDFQINYSLIGNSNFEKDLTFIVYDSEENLIDEKNSHVVVSKERGHGTVSLNIEKANKGLLKIIIAKADDRKPLVEEFFVYDKAQSITGLAFLDKVNNAAFYSIIIIAIFGVLAYFAIRRIKVLRKWGDSTSVKNFVSTPDKKTTPDVKIPVKKITWNTYDPDKDW